MNRRARTLREAAGSTEMFERLEPRVLLDGVGYFSAGFEYNMGVGSLYREFGQYDDADGTVQFGSRTNSDGSFSGSRFSGFSFGDAAALYRGDLSLVSPDAFANRVTTSFGTRKAGFSFGYGDNYSDGFSLSINYNQASNLLSRDGSFFFSGADIDDVDGIEYFSIDAAISGANITGTVHEEGGGTTPLTLQIDLSNAFGDGFTGFVGSNLLAFFGDNADTVVVTEFEPGDGFASYAWGMKVNPGANNNADDFAGDVYGVNWTGGGMLGAFIGQPSNEEVISFAGALEFADNNTWRYYGLLDYYDNGRASATVLNKGTFTTNGNEVELTDFGLNVGATYKFNADLDFTLAAEYKVGNNSYKLFGGGSKIRDGVTGDFQAATPDSSVMWDYSSSLVQNHSGGYYLVFEGDDGGSNVGMFRENISDMTGLNNIRHRPLSWVSSGGAEIELFIQNDIGTYYATRGEDGDWVSALISAAADEQFIYRPAYTGGSQYESLGGFNFSGDVVRYDYLNSAWGVSVITDVISPENNTDGEIDSSDLVITGWDAWHLFYTDGFGDLRVAWTAPDLGGQYYDNNLSDHSGLGSLGTGTDISAEFTDWGSFHVATTINNEMHQVWWAFDTDMWIDTNISAQLGGSAAAIRSADIESYFDKTTGDLYAFAVTPTFSDTVMYRWDFGVDTWTESTVMSDLGFGSYQIPELELKAVSDATNNFALLGSVPVLGNLPFVSTFFSSRADGSTDNLIIHLNAKIFDPQDP